MTSEKLEPLAQLPSRRGRRRTQQLNEEDRAIVFEAARRLLEQEGAPALSVRRLAAEVGTSYQLVYTLFGGKQGVLNALFQHGFASLAARCRAASSASALADVPTLGLVYRDFALEHPRLYALMFGRDTPGFEPDSESQREGLASFEVVRTSAARAFEASPAARQRFQDSEALARSAWSTTHGHVVLELADWFGSDPGSKERLRATLQALVAGDPRPSS